MDYEKINTYGTTKYIDIFPSFFQKNPCHVGKPALKLKQPHHNRLFKIGPINGLKIWTQKGIPFFHMFLSSRMDHKRTQRLQSLYPRRGKDESRIKIRDGVRP